MLCLCTHPNACVQMHSTEGGNVGAAIHCQHLAGGHVVDKLLSSAAPDIFSDQPLSRPPHSPPEYLDSLLQCVSP